jgi:AraC family transcriptional regulator, regulatory protein of adaptative response / methylated-DNA-[protein]-cysteine methyltransferase
MSAFAKQVEFQGVSNAPLRVFWGCHDSPLGPLMLGVSDDGLCRLEFSSGYGTTYDLSTWKADWPEAEFLPDSAKTSPIACRISQMSPQSVGAGTMALYGAEFQLKIIKAMLLLPHGKTMSYAEILQLVQRPKAA